MGFFKVSVSFILKIIHRYKAETNIDRVSYTRKNVPYNAYGFLLLFYANLEIRQYTQLFKSVVLCREHANKRHIGFYNIT